MKKRRIVLIAILGITLIAISAVVGSSFFVDSQASQLTARLSKAGLKTTLLDANRDVFFIPLGARRYSIVDEWIRIFVYPSSACARADASRMDSSGSTYNEIGYSVQLSWAKSGPHFYIDGNLIIFYGGSNSILLNTFETLFGPQFAGY